MPSEPHSSLFKRVRVWVADDLDRLALAAWRLQERVRPQYDGSLCPDCQLGPDVGDNCPICTGLLEQKIRDEALMAGAYDDGYEAAERARQAEGDW